MVNDTLKVGCLWVKDWPTRLWRTSWRFIYLITQARNYELKRSLIKYFCKNRHAAEQPAILLRKILKDKPLRY